MGFKPTEEILVKATYELTENTNFKVNKIHVAANGERLVSKQELQIYNRLLEEPDFHIIYESPYKGKDKTLFPDFLVTNKKTRETYVWEHLGMTNNEHYLNAIPNKLVWFREQGLLSTEEGGNLILTFYREKRFFKDVERSIKLIKGLL